jgi:hypothetical protein
MLHIGRQPAGGFLQSIHQWCYLGTAGVRHQQPRDGERGFFKLFQLGPQLLAVLIQLLQRFVAVDEVTIGCNTELHVLVALVGKLLII